MRWKVKPQKEMKLERVRRKFLWFPHQSGDTKYWLEWMWVVEGYDVYDGSWDTWGMFDNAEMANEYRKAHNLD